MGSSTAYEEHKNTKQQQQKALARITFDFLCCPQAEFCESRAGRGKEYTNYPFFQKLVAVKDIHMGCLLF